MSKYCAFINGVAFDYVLKRTSRGCYTFYLGHYFICRLHARYKGADMLAGWAVIVAGTIGKDVPRTVHGFSTRHDAIGYALKIHLLTKERYLRG